MKEAIPTAAALAFQNGKVLLVRHNEGAGHITGSYGLPCGRLNDPEEGLKVAAAREFREETGLEVDTDSLEPFSDNYFEADIPRKDGNIRSYSMTVFIVPRFNGELAPNEETTPEWIELTSLATFQLLPNVDKAVQAGLNFLINKK